MTHERYSANVLFVSKGYMPFIIDRAKATHSTYLHNMHTLKRNVNGSCETFPYAIRYSIGTLCIELSSTIDNNVLLEVIKK